MATFAFKSPEIVAEGLEVFDARQGAFSIHGFYQPENPGVFRRLPAEVARATSEKVWHLHTDTAGGRLRFVTDSPYIAVGAVCPEKVFTSDRTAALCGASAFSFDLYADGEFVRVLWPKTIKTEGSVVHFALPEGRYEGSYDFKTRKMRQITLNFPTFCAISEVHIGLMPGSALLPAQPYRNKKSVVFYGSSITQGACASRPGNIYQNVLSRWLDMDYVNLGFASGAFAEDAIVDYLCGLSTPVLVFDYDHNAKTPEDLRATHLPALRKLCAAHPGTPIILLSKPNRHAGEAEALERVAVIRESIAAMNAEGRENLYFVNGQEIFTALDAEMMTIDDTHPTDLGHYCMAKALRPVLEKCLNR